MPTFFPLSDGRDTVASPSLIAKQKQYFSCACILKKKRRFRGLFMESCGEYNWFLIEKYFIHLYMIYSKEIASLTAQHLLQINAIKLSPGNPFTWARVEISHLLR